MNILITGGTGFIGSRLALKCLDKGDSVKVFGQVNNTAESENKKLLEAKGAEVILGSMTDRTLIFNITAGIDVVYHLAAAQHEANVPNRIFYDVNVSGTKNILDASVQAGVRRFVHGSTIGVYGNLEGVIDEQSPCNPDNIYGETKLEGETLVLSYHEKLPVVVMRISETYGPGDRRLLKLFKAIKKKIFFMIGSGKNLHQLIYIDDLIEGLLAAADNEKALGETFLAVGIAPITTQDMVETIAAELHRNIPRFRAPLGIFLVMAVIMEKVLRPLGIQPPIHKRRMDFFKKSFNFSPDKALYILNFSARTSFKKGVSETIRWYEEVGLL